MTVSERVIQRFGGIAALARCLGHKNRSTVQGWSDRGSIPALQWPAIERAAKVEGFKSITVLWLGLEHAKQAQLIATRERA